MAIFAHDAIIIHRTKHCLLNYAQHGFAPKKVPITNLISVLFDKKQEADIAFLDLSKALNAVNHRLRHTKLAAIFILIALKNGISFSKSLTGKKSSCRSILHLLFQSPAAFYQIWYNAHCYLYSLQKTFLYLWC